jgi:RimJ/RimL family protein N-acetyltransferase
MKKIIPETIIGDQIVLEPFTDKYISSRYLSWMNDADSTRYILKAQEDTTLEDISSFAFEMMNSECDYFFAIILKSTMTHVGNVRIGAIDLYKRESKFGVLIGENIARGKGIGTEVVELVKAFCFCQIGLDKLAFPVVKEHVPAMRLYAKTGFKCLGVIDDLFIKDNYKPLELVEWEMQNPYR